MISTNSILFTAIFVFGLMFIGMFLTALEFRRLNNASKEDKEEQEQFTRRHRAELVKDAEPPKLTTETHAAEPTRHVHH